MVVLHLKRQDSVIRNISSYATFHCETKLNKRVYLHTFKGLLYFPPVAILTTKINYAYFYACKIPYYTVSSVETVCENGP